MELIREMGVILDSVP
jgi:hypothetical protein